MQILKKKGKGRIQKLWLLVGKKYVEQIGEDSMVNMPADARVERVKMMVILTL